MHGFTILAVTPLPDLRLTACEAQHVRTGARVLHLVADDPENLFSIALLTPPTDDTGVPHILEHMVLSGSQKFPVRDPFFEMVKLSMATFINALTASDHTVYPVSSNVKQDLFNLADVYFDAVFHPLLERDAFCREGHHLAPIDPQHPVGALTLNGIVFNEMKAALSRPESRLYHLTARHLFRNSTYGYLSGGDPVCIPDLTYEQLRTFHARYYHPANARFVFYGNISTEEYLAFLEPRLASFSPPTFTPTILRPSSWKRPRRVADAYPIGPREPLTERTFLLTTWHVGDALDPEAAMLMQLLSTLLLGDDAAPLKKALVDSHLGLDVLAGGAGDEGPLLVFSVGLRGSEPDRSDAFGALVRRTLEETATEPWDPERVEAAFRKQAYESLEIPSHYPLVLMEQVTDAWLYGRDPLLFVRQKETWEACRRRYRECPEIFSHLIRERLLNNPHRLDVVLRPDRRWQDRTDRAFRKTMRIWEERLTEADRCRLAEQAKELARKAGEPNPPEAVARLPQLRVGDIPSHPVHIPTQVEPLPTGGVFLRNEVFANGVNYLLLDVDLHGLPSDLWKEVPRYQEMLLKLGAAGHTYEQMARRISAHTGSLECRTSLSRRVDGEGRPAWGLRIALRMLDDQTERALQIVRDLLFEPDPNDRRRWEDVLCQSLARLRTGLVNGGPSTALRHVLRGLTPEGYVQETMAGISQLGRVEYLSSNVDREFSDLLGRLLRMAAFLRDPRRITMSFTGSDRPAQLTREALGAWLKAMPESPVAEAPLPFQPAETVERIGLAAPIPVAHCVQAIPSLPPGHEAIPWLMLGLGLVGLDYMIPELRLQGHAYGANCSYAAPGVVALTTYADPHITRTLQVFARLPHYVRRAAWTQTEINRGIIRTAKHYVAPIRPEEATEVALSRYLTAQTREFREAQYERLRSATPERVRAVLLETLERGLPHAPVCVMASRRQLEQASRECPSAELRIVDVLEAVREASDAQADGDTDGSEMARLARRP